MKKSRNNHYVPEWYQKQFLRNGNQNLYYLNLSPDPVKYPDGRPVIGSDGKPKFHHAIKPTAPEGCFVQRDLYSTFLAPILHDAFINDDIERMLFGNIDTKGSQAIKAFIEGGEKNYHDHFHNFFEYMDVQKLRTPKGLRWIASQYTRLDQNTLMREMQALQQRHCAIWMGGVREIISARNSAIKFIISDHPVTTYNIAMPPRMGGNEEPSIILRATQTIYPLDQETCLILSNLEYAQNPNEKPLSTRTNPKLMSQSLVMTHHWIRTRELNEQEVAAINLVIKRNALQYLAAGEKEWLYPENIVGEDWKKVKGVLLPPKDELHGFGGEMYMRLGDGRVIYQDAFGRSSKSHETLTKKVDEKSLRAGDLCGCGSGRLYKKCCRGIPDHLRSSWSLLSIRERNIGLYNGMNHILGLKEGLDWEQARQQLTDEKVRRIYEVFAAFWPVDTPIYDLLPKPDGRSRTVYMGVIDPRNIPATAINATMYHDEVIIQHPMMHPENIKPEFNPLNAPQKFHIELIKLYILLDLLMPYIECGLINLVPDITIFDAHLRHLAMTLPAIRLKDREVSEGERAFMRRLHDDDFKRTIRLLPEDVQRLQLRKIFPEMAEDELAGTIDFMRRQKVDDPLAPLTENVLGDSGQFMSFALAPNLEVGLLLAQVTGATITTDSPFRWQELQSCRRLFQGMPLTMFGESTDTDEGYDVRIRANPADVFDMRIRNSHQNLRKVLNDFVKMVRNTKDFESAHKQEAQILPTLRSEIVKLNAELDGLQAKDEASLPNIPAKMHILAPLGGISHHHAQRILALSGIENFSKEVPVAFTIAFEPDQFIQTNEESDFSQGATEDLPAASSEQN